MGDEQDALDSSDVAFLICSKLLRSLTFYPLLTAALLMYQDVTESFAMKSVSRQFLRGFVAMTLIGLYVYMFGFHYIFLRELAADIVFYTTLPQVALFLLIYTRLGAVVHRYFKDLIQKFKEVSRTDLSGVRCSREETGPRDIADEATDSSVSSGRQPSLGDTQQV
jgi:hypothetical protein